MCYVDLLQTQTFQVKSMEELEYFSQQKTSKKGMLVSGTGMYRQHTIRYYHPIQMS